MFQHDQTSESEKLGNDNSHNREDLWAGPLSGEQGCQTVGQFSGKEDPMWSKRVCSFSSAGHGNESTGQGSNPACGSLRLFRKCFPFILRKALRQDTLC